MRPNPALFTVMFIMSYALTIDSTAISYRGVTAALATETTAQRWVAEQNAAVQQARRGDTAAALVVLERLHREHPDDIGIARDTAVVAAWAGQDIEAIQIFVALPPGPQPDYVIDPIAQAYRHLKQPAEALVLYRQGLARSPSNALFADGEIRSLADLNQTDAAIVRANADLKAHGERVDILLAAAYAVSAQRKFVEALRYIDRAIKRDPASSKARHDRILAINDMGAPQVARQLANDNPGLLSAAELRRVDGDSAAALVRWGVLEPPDEERRFEATDRAIVALDALIARWSQEGDAAQGDVLRARFDRMVALRDRVRMPEVIAEYEDLERHGVVVPNYVQVAAADAYLYVRQPEKARDLYLQGLAVDPLNPQPQQSLFYADTLLALFYAYVDLDDFKSAYDLSDRSAAAQPMWVYLKGLTDPVENRERANADLTAADARLYADELAEAHRRIAAMAEAAPNNTNYLSELAAIYSARGWPRRAEEQYDITRSLRPKNASTEVGQALNNLQLREYRTAEAQVADLKRRFPESREVQRLARLWDVQNMAEFRLHVEQAQRSSTNVQGGRGLSVDAELYSPPIAYNWRLFGSEYVAHEQLPDDAGTITLRRSAVGAEYRDRNLIASLEGTVSTYGPSVGTTVRNDLDQGRGGARALATWSVNDYWDIGGSAELFARDTPLRALSQGITANAASTNVVYRESESRKVMVNAAAMDFSDGNFRNGLTGEYTQRLYTRPRFTIDGILGLGESQNSLDNNRPYFNPRQDAQATYGVSFIQVIKRRYEFLYDHHLVITPGTYWERGYGDSGLLNVLYEHRIRANDTLEAGLGVNFARQAYDGNYENTVSLIFNLRQRF